MCLQSSDCSDFCLLSSPRAHFLSAPLVQALKDGEESAVRNKPRISRKILSSHSGSSSKCVFLLVEFLFFVACFKPVYEKAQLPVCYMVISKTLLGLIF